MALARFLLPWPTVDRSPALAENRDAMRRDGQILTIGKAAALLRVSASSLRNWERHGLVTPVRSAGRYRLYSRALVSQLERIRSLRRDCGLNLSGIGYLQRGAGADGTPAAHDEEAVDVGERLARLRRQRGLTLAVAAARSGVSASHISAIERRQANPSIATLQKLAHLYSTNVLWFFGGGHRGRRLVRARERRVLRPEPGVQMELLALGKHQIEPHLFRLAPRASSGGSYQHEGEEFVYVLQGSLEIWLDEIERYVLEPGDSLCFASTYVHRWRNFSQGETVALWINTPPTF
jgi:DNA-binding transcriptional MerR regulator/quercetin dioxygenase-like cupin family protein